MVYKTSLKLKPEKLKDIRNLMQDVPESMKKLYKSLKWKFYQCYGDYLVIIL